MKRTWMAVIGGLALLALSQWLRVGPRSAEANADESFSRGDYEQALREYQRAAGVGADANRMTFNQAAALYRLERFGDADTRYNGVAAEGDATRKARAAYDRGNCALHEACRAEGIADARLLGQAMEDYRACLEQETATSGDDSLFKDARHNLELAKLILSGGSSSRQPSPENRPEGSGKHDSAAQPEKSLSWSDSAGQAAKKSPTHGARQDLLASLTPECGVSKPQPKSQKELSCST
jgi:hypothetical protein